MEFGPLAFKAVRQLLVNGYDHPRLSRSSSSGHDGCAKEGDGPAMTPYTHINDLAKEAPP
jgi:hypothetical protein